MGKKLMYGVALRVALGLVCWPQFSAHAPTLENKTLDFEKLNGNSSVIYEQKEKTFDYKFDSKDYLLAKQDNFSLGKDYLEQYESFK